MSVAIGLAVIALVGFTVVGRGKLRQSWDIARQIRPGMVLTNIPVIVAVLLTAGLLYQVPWLQWGWYRLVSGHDGNVVLAAGTDVVWLLPVLAVLLIVAVPLLAMGGEVDFRVGTKTWPQAFRRSLVFGLVHLLAGVPIAAALALTIAGLWFTRQYFKGGVVRSAAYHAAWNYTVLALAIGLVVATK